MTAPVDHSFNTSPSRTGPTVIRLYALGSNGNYQLGLPHANDTSVPETCIFNLDQGLNSPGSFRDLNIVASTLGSLSKNTTAHNGEIDYIPFQSTETIVDLKTGGNHTLLLTSGGRVFAAGSNEHGQLGLQTPLDLIQDGTANPIPTFTHAGPSPGFHHLTWTGALSSVSPKSSSLPANASVVTTRITHIACTFTATLLVSTNTTLYTTGHGPKGELALGPDTTTAPIPTKVLDIRDHEDEPNTQIESLAACMDHALLLSTNGNVYGWGAARKGQLGERLRSFFGHVCWRVSRTDLDLAGCLSFRPRQVVTTKDYTVLLGESGVGQWEQQHEQFLCGKQGNLAFPLKLDLDPNPEETASSDYHARSDGHSTAGLREASTYQHEIPYKSPRIFENDDTNGTNYGTHNGLTDPIPRTDENNDDSNTAQSHQKHHLSHRTRDQTILHAGWSALTSHNPHLGTIKGHGPNTHSQHPPPSLCQGKVQSLAVGSEHSVALLNDGTVVAWGWGEHGNCGAEVDGRGNVPAGNWNVIFGGDDGPRGEKMEVEVLGVGAGCASSFFWVREDLDR